MKSLTPRQLEILQAFRRIREESSLWPTLAELAAEMGVSRVVIFEHIGRLIKKGYVQKCDSGSRKYSLTQTGIESAADNTMV